MERKEVVRKVRSVCEGVSPVEAERKGLVTVGSHLVFLRSDEMFTPMSEHPYERSRGCIVVVKEIEYDGAPICTILPTSATMAINLARLAYQSDYEAAYCDATTEQQKEEYSQMNAEDQCEWLLENPAGKMTKELSAQELKVLYDAAWTCNYNKDVIVEYKNSLGYWRSHTDLTPKHYEIYRVKRKVVATPLDIPWSIIDDAYNYAAMDKSCKVYFYDSEPEEGDEAWYPTNLFDKSPLKHDIDGVNWKRSLTKRPR